MTVIEKIKGKVIISVQAMPNEPLYEESAMTAMIKSVVNGNPAGLRLAGERDIKISKKLYPELPVIGITKPEKIPQNYKEIVYITPRILDAITIIKAGADIVAFDGTQRKRPEENLSQLIKYIKSNKKLAMADISTFEEGIEARNLGADILSTTLSGYTTNSNQTLKGPDFELLEKLVKNTDCPVILEGRIWTAEEVDKAFELGAHSVVIGSAVTRPQLIVKRFINRGK